MKITGKIYRVVYVIATFLILILVRTWYLAVIQHDKHVLLSQKPQRRVIIEKPDRATIEDRFGIPLAINKIQYNVSVRYSDIRQLPSFTWKKNEKGHRVRVSERANYINRLSNHLASEIGVPAKKIEDMIHGQASLLPHTPFTIKEDIPEELYYRLKAMEKDWMGLQVEKVSRREYPLGKVAADVIGYLGKMDSNYYLRIVHQLKTLEEYLKAREQGEVRFLPEGFKAPEEVAARFVELQEKAYTMNDLIGKSGIEAFYDEQLRGYVGRHIYEIDRKGNILSELPGSRKAIPGKKITLTISAELQDFAEKLLASNEGPRIGKPDGGINEKWMRGSAAVAIIPKTGEVVALASYPRFDPNDFIPSRDPDTKREKEFAVKEWLETDDYLGDVWDGKRELKREYYSFVKAMYIDEKILLTWHHYLDAILPGKCALKDALLSIETVRKAIEVQKEGLNHALLSTISHEVEKDLILDICHLVVPLELFTQELLNVVGDQSLSDYFASRQEAMQMLEKVKGDMRDVFYDNDFTHWREAHFKDYLKEMREKEKKEHRYARPFTDYLNRLEKILWDHFWKAYRPVFLYSALTGKIPISLEDYPHLTPYLCMIKEVYLSTIKNNHSQLRMYLQILSPYEGVQYLKTLRSFDELKGTLRRKYPRLRSSQGFCTEKHLAQAFYPRYGYGFTRSQTYRQASPPGSVFKLVTAYQTLLERYRKSQPLNPLTIVDDWVGSPSSPSFKVGYLENGTPIHRNYKGGRMPRSSHPGMGHLDLKGAIEQSSNVYFSLLASEVIEHPLNLSKAAYLFGMGRKTGIDLPFEAPGLIPTDIDRNKTGLYTFAIGQHTLEVTPLQSAVMTAAIANKGVVVRPYIVQKLEGIERNLKYPCSEKDVSLGLSAADDSCVEKEQFVSIVTQPAVERRIDMPEPVFKELFEGMRLAVQGRRGTARPSAMRILYDHPTSIKDYIEVHKDLVSKTGTAQALYKKSLAVTAPPIMEHYISFASIAYYKDSILLDPLKKEPELVVVIFLRYRQAGLEGGPLAGQIFKEWRRIKESHGLR